MFSTESKKEHRKDFIFKHAIIYHVEQNFTFLFVFVNTLLIKIQFEELVPSFLVWIRVTVKLNAE